MIQKGAKLVTRVQDILDEFGEQYSERESVEPQVKTIGQEETLTVKEHPLVSLCKDPISIDDLMLITAYDLASLQIELFNLQLEGTIQQNFMGLWQSA